MKLNTKQKEYLIKDFIGAINVRKIFDSISVQWVIDQKIEIKEGFSGWYDLYMNGEKYTSLNFKTYPEVLENLKNMFTK